jgi:NhaP-type Na+/H+ or K+/H+ antiporter
MNLNLERLRGEGRSIRQMVIAGSLATAVGGALAARLVMGWSWPLAVLFGTLVMVTGPTVITPLLRRIKVEERVATVLEAEGVLVDAIGSVAAVVALEAALGAEADRLSTGAWGLGSRLLIGTLVGLAGGVLLALLLRRERAVPEGLESVFTLAAVLLLYQLGNALVPESGIVAVVAAGLVVGNAPPHVLGELRSFKEQLSVLFVGVLFVLLAADVRLAEVAALGWPGVTLVALLMLVVRPAAVLAGTWGTALSARERAFLSWLAPRGIVAAAISSLFATRLEQAGMSGGGALRAMVFLVIATTVVLQGVTGGALAGLLGLRRPSGQGFVVLGAHALARRLGGLLSAGGTPVVLVDSNPENAAAAAAEGLAAVHGSGLEQEVQERVALDTRAGCIGFTTNEEVNLLFARQGREEWKVPRAWVAIRRNHLGIDERSARQAGARVLCGAPQPFTGWITDCDAGMVEVLALRRTAQASTVVEPLIARGDLLLPLVLHGDRGPQPVDAELRAAPGDLLYVAVRRNGSQAAAVLAAAGWEPAGEAMMTPRAR